MRVIAWNECDGNERVVMQLVRKRREANTVVAEIERRVYILQEHVANHPESCHP